MARGLRRDAPSPEILRRLETSPFGMELPAATDALTLEMDSGRQIRDLQVTTTGVDEAGRAHTARLRRSSRAPSTYELPLDGSVRLLSITIHRTSLDARRGHVHDRVRRGGRRGRLARGMEPLTWRSSGGSVEAEGSGVRYEMESGASDVIGGIVPPSGPLPVLVSPAIASADGPIFPATLGGQETSWSRSRRPSSSRR